MDRSSGRPVMKVEELPAALAGAPFNSNISPQVGGGILERADPWQTMHISKVYARRSGRGQQGGRRAKKMCSGPSWKGTAAVIDYGSCGTGLPVPWSAVWKRSAPRSRPTANARGSDHAKSLVRLQRPGKAGSKATQKYLRHRTFKSISSGVIGVGIGDWQAPRPTWMSAPSPRTSMPSAAPGASLQVPLHRQQDPAEQDHCRLDRFADQDESDQGDDSHDPAGGHVDSISAGRLDRGIAAAAAKLGVKFTMTKLCLACVGRSCTGVPFRSRPFPADPKLARHRQSSMNCSRATAPHRVFGKYDVDQFVKGRAAGWRSATRFC